MNKYLNVVILYSLLCFQASAATVDTWVQDARLQKAQDIAVGPDGKVWLVSGQSIVQWDINDPLGAKLIPLAAGNKKIIINKKNGNLVIFKDRKLVTLDPERLEFLSGIASRIAVDKDGHLWVVTVNGSLYKRIDNIWQRFPGNLSDIAIGINGQIWGLGDKLTSQAGYPVLKLNGKKWQDTGGIAYDNQLAVDADGEAWIVRSTGANSGIFRSQGNRWKAMPEINRPSGITSDLDGNIWVSGLDQTYQRIRALFKWQGASWKPSFPSYVGHFGIMPSGNPVSPGFYIVENEVPQKSGIHGTSYTPDLGVINFTLDKNDVVWVIRDTRPHRNRAPEILTWDDKRFKTAIETKKFWEHRQDQLTITDWPLDIAVDGAGIPWIIAGSHLYRRQQNNWVEAGKRTLIDIISSPRGDIWALDDKGPKRANVSSRRKQIRYGGTIYRWKNSKLVRVGQDKAYIYKLAVDNNDIPWILARDFDFKGKGTRLAVFRLQQNAWVKVPIMEPYQATMEFGNGVDGSLWLGARHQANKVLLKWNGKEWQKYQDHFNAHQVNGDSSGHPVAILRGGFVTNNPQNKASSQKKRVAANPNK